MGGAQGAGECPTPPTFSLTNTPFPMLIRGWGTPPIIPLRSPATAPPRSSSCSSPTSPLPTPPFPACQHPTHPLSASQNLSYGRGTSFRHCVRTPPPAVRAAALFLACPTPFIFHLFISLIFMFISLHILYDSANKCNIKKLAQRDGGIVEQLSSLLLMMSW